MSDPSITWYLQELHALLPMGRRRRQRVVTEARDHLLSSVEQLVAQGVAPADAPAIALAAFGSARIVAQSHARAAVALATSRLLTPLAVTLIPFTLLVTVTTQLAAVRSGAPAHAVAGGVAGVVGWVAVQLAAGCGVLTFLRLSHLRSTAGCSGGDARLIHRGAGVMLSAIGASLALDLEAFHRMPAGEGQSAALVFGLAFAAGIALLWAGMRLRTALRRVRGMERIVGREAPTGDLSQLLQGLAAGARRWDGRTTGPARARVLALADSGIRWCTDGLNHRPGRVALWGAGLVGTAAAIGHLVSEGPSTRGIGLGLVAFLVLAAAEGAVVLASYVALGGFLGIRRPAGGVGS